MISRRTFVKKINAVHPGLCAVGGPMWITEIASQQAKWFICVRPLNIYETTSNFWDWCDHNLHGKVRCYSSTGGNSFDDINEEWWGFTHKEDIVWWKLRWI